MWELKFEIACITWQVTATRNTYSVPLMRKGVLQPSTSTTLRPAAGEECGGVHLLETILNDTFVWGSVLTSRLLAFGRS